MKSLNFLPVLFLVAACGGKVVFDQTSGSNGASGGGHAGQGGAPDAGHPAQGGGVTVGQGGAGAGGFACLDGGLVAPEPLKACGNDAECALGTAPRCCGDLEVGINQAELGAFASYEKACNHGPLCDCVGPPRAEDGKTGMIQVACQGGRCVSFVP